MDRPAEDVDEPDTLAGDDGAVIGDTTEAEEDDGESRGTPMVLKTSRRKTRKAPTSKSFP